MSNFQIKYILQMRDSMSHVLDKVRTQVKKFESASKIAFANISKHIQKMNNATAGLKKFGKTVGDVGGKLTKRITLPFGLLGGAVLRSAGSLEQMETSLQGLLGSATKAKAVMDEVREFSTKTPFQLPGLVQASKHLLVAGVSTDELISKMKVLGDISSASGKPLTELSAIFLKVRNKGKAMTEEINMISEGGIPIIEELGKMLKEGSWNQKIIDTKKMGIDELKSAVYDLAQDGAISSKILEEALGRMTKKGGFAFQAMELQSKTFFGRLSTLKDTLVNTAGATGSVFIDDINKLIIKVTEIGDRVKVWVEGNKSLVKTILKIGLVLAVLGPALIVIGQMTTGIIALAKGIGLVGFALKAVFLLMKTNPMGMAFSLVIGAISTLLVMFPSLREKIKNFGMAVFEVTKKLLAFTPIGLAIKGLISLFKMFPNIFTTIKDTATASFDAVLEKILMVTNAMKSVIGKVKSIGGKVKGFFTRDKDEPRAIGRTQGQQSVASPSVYNPTTNAQTISGGLGIDVNFNQAPQGMSVKSQANSNAIAKTNIKVNTGLNTY